MINSYRAPTKKLFDLLDFFPFIPSFSFRKAYIKSGSTIVFKVSHGDTKLNHDGHVMEGNNPEGWVTLHIIILIFKCTNPTQDTDYSPCSTIVYLLHTGTITSTFARPRAGAVARRGGQSDGKKVAATSYLYVATSGVWSTLICQSFFFPHLGYIRCTYLQSPRPSKQ